MDEKMRKYVRNIVIILEFSGLYPIMPDNVGIFGNLEYVIFAVDNTISQ